MTLYQMYLKYVATACRFSIEIGKNPIPDLVALVYSSLPIGNLVFLMPFIVYKKTSGKSTELTKTEIIVIFLLGVLLNYVLAFSKGQYEKYIRDRFSYWTLLLVWIIPFILNFLLGLYL